MKAAITALALLVAARPAAAGPDLTVHHFPMPSPGTLAMRQNATPSPDPTPTPTAASSADNSLRERIQDAFARSFLDLPKHFSHLDEKIVFHLDVGVGMDAGDPSNIPMTSGATLTETDNGGFYQPLRIYTFGDAVVGSRGLLLPSLSTYFASQFRFDHAGRPPTGAIPTAYDGSSSGSAMLPRHAYAELHDVFDSKWLKPLFIRAGRQFRYGAAIAHFDGLTLGYDTRAVSFGAFSGTRVSLYGLGKGIDDAPRLIAGSNFRINLYRLRKLPLVLGARFLNFDEIEHFVGEMGLRLSRDVLFRATLRASDGSLAQEHASVRARLSKVTTIHVVLDNRHRSDFAYDLIVGTGASDYGPDDPRRYLNLGRPLPRAKLSVRAGTVLFDNLDLLLRAAVAREHSDEDQPLHPFSPSYVEGGIATEVRFRRSLRLGGSLLARRYRRKPAEADLADVEALLADPLALGEHSFYEGDVSFQYTSGARRFDARADFYSRVYQGARQYVVPGVDEFKVELRSGARFSVSSWIDERLRLKGEYETSFAPEFLAPEIRGAKSLRVIMEAVF